MFHKAILALIIVKNTVFLSFVHVLTALLEKSVVRLQKNFLQVNNVRINNFFLAPLAHKQLMLFFQEFSRFEEYRMIWLQMRNLIDEIGVCKFTDLLATLTNTIIATICLYSAISLKGQILPNMSTILFFSLIDITIQVYYGARKGQHLQNMVLKFLFYILTYLAHLLVCTCWSAW